MAKDLTTDVLVVGGGPSGSMTAKWAAKHGAKVLLIEKRQEIGSPVRCGEGMSKEWLKDVGITPSPRWINLEVEGARIFSPSEKVFEINEKDAGNEVGYVVERDAFGEGHRFIGVAVHGENRWDAGAHVGDWRELWLSGQRSECRRRRPVEVDDGGDLRLGLTRTR